MTHIIPLYLMRFLVKNPDKWIESSPRDGYDTELMIYSK